MSVFRPREKFLILEVGPKETCGLFLSVDEDRNIIFEKFEKGVNLAKFLRAPSRRVADQSWEGRPLFNGRRRLAVAADASLATTIPVPLELHRDAANAKSRITLAELENLIAQAMARIFNGCRTEAAGRLGLSDLDAVLVSAKAKQFGVDRSDVEDPVGYPGKKITLLLEFTFTGRALAEELKPFFNSPEPFFFAEAPQAHLASLARVRALPLSLVAADGDGTSLFVLQKAKDDYAVLYREALDWRFNSLFEALQEAFGVSPRAAKDLYCAYRRGEVSEGVARVFRAALEPALDAFFREMARAKVSGTAYVDHPHGLPTEASRRRGGARFEPHPAEEIAAHLGFTADLDAFRVSRDDRARVRRLLIYFLESYFDKSSTEINQKLRRRLHWLAA